MVLTPCQFGKGDQPKCDCGPLGDYQPETTTQPGKCICNTNAYYDETTKQCKCPPGFISKTGKGGKEYCYDDRISDKDYLTYLGYGAGGVAAVALGVGVLIYVGIKIRNYFGQPPPIVAAVVAPVAPILPGVSVIQNNPMLLNGAA